MPAPDSLDIDLLSSGEVATLLDVSVATVNRWALTGQLPVAYRLPGRTGANLFRRQDAERLLPARRGRAS